MDNVLGADDKRRTLLTTLIGMARSNFVSAKVQQQRGTNEAFVRITNTTKTAVAEAASVQNPLQNQMVAPDNATNVGNCQGPIMWVYFVKDIPA